MKQKIVLAELDTYNGELDSLAPGKMLVSTINAYSYILAHQDPTFADALTQSDILLPDGVSIVLGKRLLTGKRIRKIAGEDFFFYEMNRLNKTGGTCFFLGSSESVLTKIREASSRQFPHVKVHTYSPPYKPVFSREDSEAMLEAVRSVNPDVLFIGMTAPKQEKWAHQHFEELQAGHIVCIGAVFDFYAGTIKRAPRLVIRIGMEWLYRLIKEPQRMWRRYILGNPQYILLVIREYWQQSTRQYKGVH
jgi:N-acetylglucosaminyldiphosphoundecaprenol N-acetyl-beta-D-mannosaminyltransferase